MLSIQQSRGIAWHIAYLTTSAARSAAEDTTRVCGVPFSIDALDGSEPLVGLNALMKAGSWPSCLGSLNEDVSRNAVSDIN